MDWGVARYHASGGKAGLLLNRTVLIDLGRGLIRARPQLIVANASEGPDLLG
jgi:hypothetical protein